MFCLEVRVDAEMHVYTSHRAMATFFFIRTHSLQPDTALRTMTKSMEFKRSDRYSSEKPSLSKCSMFCARCMFNSLVFARPSALSYQPLNASLATLRAKHMGGREVRELLRIRRGPSKFIRGMLFRNWCERFSFSTRRLKTADAQMDNRGPLDARYNFQLD